MYIPDLNLGSIPFKIVSLCSDTPIPAPLSLLERVLEVLFSKLTKHILRFPLLCNSQCSYRDATWHTKWRRSLLSRIAHIFTYCDRLAVCGSSLGTFWYTYVYIVSGQVFRTYLSGKLLVYFETHAGRVFLLLWSDCEINHLKHRLTRK